MSKLDTIGDYENGRRHQVL